MSTTASIVVLLAAVVLPVVVIGALFTRWLARRAALSSAALAARLAGEPALRGPESGAYHGATGGYPAVAGSGHLALTSQRLLFHKLTGGAVEVLLCDVTGVRTSRWFSNSAARRQAHLVVETVRGDVAFRVRELRPWVEAISRARARSV